MPVALLQMGVLWFVAFLGGFVFYEPAPYELVLPGIIALWFAAGLAVPRAAGPLFVLMLTFTAGSYLALTQSRVIDQEPVYLAVSTFLAISACFFACVIAADPDRLLRPLVNGWIAGAVGSTALGIAGYFGFAPGQDFTLYGRAAGGFADPNVYGPFLIFPLIVIAQRALTGTLRAALFNGAIGLFLFFGLFLSFSRGAWGVALVALALAMVVLFVNERRPMVRARYLALALVGAVGLASLLAVALSFDAISSLFVQRAHVVQDYDGGNAGRFARHAMGFNAMLERPLGFGALEFGHIFHGDEHNIWLKSLTTYGWIGFVSFVTLSIWTVAAGFRLMFRSSPYQTIAQAAVIALFAHLLLGFVIDIDHWRHVYLLFGLVWGLIAASRQATGAHHRQVSPAPGYREIAIGV